MNPILAKIIPEDVYDGFPDTDYEEDITGWDGDNALFEKVITSFSPKVIVEVGTWKGQSAFTMADVCAKLRLPTVIICVDTWLGSDEHWITWPDQLRRVNGYPTLYRQFLANVVKRGLQERIVPLATTSLTAAALLAHCKIQADMVYIDANHIGEAVRSDMEHYWPLVTPGGLLFGHDLQHPPVRNALDAFCAFHSIKTWNRHEAFWLVAKT